jgi:hypothetical protein
MPTCTWRTHCTRCRGTADRLRRLRFGYWLYDLTVPSGTTATATTTAFRTALLAGYADYRELPGLTQLDNFIATRDVAFGLWYAGMAQVNPSFAADLDRMMNYIQRSVDQVL